MDEQIPDIYAIIWFYFVFVSFATVLYRLPPKDRASFFDLLKQVPQNISDKIEELNDEIEKLNDEEQDDG